MEETVIIEEMPIAKPRPTGWIVFGILVGLALLVFGLRAMNKQEEEISEAATPTPIPPN